jgi:selenide,water dikinase
LLVACAPEGAEAVLGRITKAGFPAARIIGRAEEGVPGITVKAD